LVAKKPVAPSDSDDSSSEDEDVKKPVPAKVVATAKPVEKIAKKASSSNSSSDEDDAPKSAPVKPTVTAKMVEAVSKTNGSLGIHSYTYQFLFFIFDDTANSSLKKLFASEFYGYPGPMDQQFLRSQTRTRHFSGRFFVDPGQNRLV